MAKVTSLAEVYVNGEKLPTKKDGAKFTPGMVKKESVPGLDGSSLGRIQAEAVLPAIEITLAHLDSVNLRNLLATEEATVVGITHGGKQYTLINADCIEGGEVENGEYSLKFEADDWKEST